MLPGMSRYRLGFFITLASAIAYAIWPSALRAAYLDGANASFAILIAMLGRSMPIFIRCFLQRHKIFTTKQDVRSGVVGGFFQATSSAAAMAAVMFLPGPLVIVIMFTHTLMLLGYMIWRGETKAEIATLGTTASALIGLCLVLDLFHKQTSSNLTGMALAFASAVAIASRLYVYGHQMKTKPPMVVGTENFLFAVLFTLPAVFWQTPVAPHSLQGWAWMGLGALSLAGGTLGQFYAISLLGAFRYSLFLKMEPLFSTIFAALLIGDILKPMQYIGVLLVVGSLALFQVVDHYRGGKQDPMLNTNND